MTRLYAMLVSGVLLVGCQSGPTVVDDESEPGVSEPGKQDESVENEGEVVELKLSADFDVQGHRGARGLRPESTLPSFEIALDYMVDTIELDLHLSKDDELIIWHDPFIEASLCSSEGHKDLPDPDELEQHDPRLLLRNMTAEQLSRYRCNRNPDVERFPHQSEEPTALAGDDFSIVTLERFFDFVDHYAESPEKSEEQRENARAIRFNIETKREPAHPEFIGDGFDGESPATFERRLVELVEDRAYQERVTMQSFDHRSLWAAATIAPWLTLVVLDREIETPFKEFKDRGASVWSPRARLVTPESLQGALEAGLTVIPWTVNDTEEMERLIELGVDGIITDRPDLLVQYR